MEFSLGNCTLFSWLILWNDHKLKKNVFTQYGGIIMYPEEKIQKKLQIQNIGKSMFLSNAFQMQHCCVIKMK